MKTKSIKYKDLIKLFKNLRKQQITLFIICLLSITAEILLTYQVQGLVDAIVDATSFNALLNVFYKIIYNTAHLFSLWIY